MTTQQSNIKLIEIQETPQEYQHVIFERIRKIGSFSLLGPPDLLHITRVKVKTQFLSKSKKQIKSSFTFFTGLNIQNIAYLNSFVTKLINSEKKQKTNNGDIEKAYFCIFDAYRRIDIHIQINIPGSNIICGYDKNQKKVSINQEIYASAFYSSTLRAMNIKHFPFLKIYDEISSRKFLTNFIISFIPYALNNFIEGTRQVNVINTGLNFTIDLLIKYLIKKQANVLLKQVIETTKLRNEQLSHLFLCQIQYTKQNFRKVVKSSAEVLVNNPTFSSFLFIQAKSLLQCKRYNQVIKITRSIIFQGFGNYQVWNLLAKAYFYIKDYRTLFILMNTAISLCQEPPEYLNPTSRQMTKLEIPNIMLVNESFNVIKPNIIKQSSLLVDYYFKFDNWFLDKFGKIKSLKDNLKKLNKQLQIADFLEKTQKSLKNNNSFYKILIMVERQKNWQYLINVRNQVFWLESDFENITKLLYQNFTQSQQKQPNPTQVSFEPGLDINQRSFIFFSQQNDRSSTSSIQKNKSVKRNTIQQQIKQTQNNQRQIPKFVFQQQDRIQQKIQRFQKSFELDPSNLSQSNIKHTTQIDLKLPEPCSARVKNVNLQNKQMLINQIYRQKNLCNNNFEKLFTDLYEDLKLQIKFDEWMKQLKSHQGLTNQKSQIISITLIKKSFLNKKLMRYRKSEETLKLALLYTKRHLTKVVSVYSLAQIYIETKNFKGALTYLQELLNILAQIGLKQYDIIPLWLQELVMPIMNNLGSTERIRMSIQKWKSGILKQVFQICFRKFKIQQ